MISNKTLDFALPLFAKLALMSNQLRDMCLVHMETNYAMETGKLFLLVYRSLYVPIGLYISILSICLPNELYILLYVSLKFVNDVCQHSCTNRRHSRVIKHGYF